MLHTFEQTIHAISLPLIASSSPGEKNFARQAMGIVYTRIIEEEYDKKGKKPIE